MKSKTHILAIAGIALFPVTAVSLLGAQAFAAETTPTATSPANTQSAPIMGMKGMHGGPHAQLTDTEKTALESMSETEKKAFFEKKMTEQRAKMDARDAVIDKLLNGESLTDADKAIVAEIKAERVKMKEMRSKMDAIRTKLQNNETLTADEQAIVDAHKKGSKGSMKDGKRGQKPSSQTTVSQ